MADHSRRYYVYAVVGAEEAAELALPADGVHGAPVTVLSGDGVAAVVSPLDGGRVRSTGADLSAHERVVEEVATCTTSVPLQFGLVISGEKAVIDEFLAPNEAQLARLLSDLSGKAEYRLKVTYRGDVALREAVRGSGAIRRLRERVRAKGEAASYKDRIQLGELVAAAVQQIGDDDAYAILRSVDRHTEATVILPSQSGKVAVYAGFLVDRGGADDFDHAVDQLAEDLNERLSFELIGPLAPWDFLGEDVYERPAAAFAGRR